MGKAANLRVPSGAEAIAMLTDVSDCIGCKACEVACKQWNQKPWDLAKQGGTYQSHPDLSAQTWTLVQFNEQASPAGDIAWRFRKHNCMHCTDAPCIEECPVDALSHAPNGTVVLDLNRCVGAGECVEECPYGAIHLDRTQRKGNRKSGKCTLCYDRVTNGLAPACVKACPTDCIKFGARSDLIRWGKQRVADLQARGLKGATLYGETEQGGLHQLYVLTGPPDLFGLTTQSGEREQEGGGREGGRQRDEGPDLSRRRLIGRLARKPLRRIVAGSGVAALLAGLIIRRMGEERSE